MSGGGYGRLATATAAGEACAWGSGAREAGSDD